MSLDAVFPLTRCSSFPPQKRLCISFKRHDGGGTGWRARLCFRHLYLWEKKPHWTAEKLFIGAKLTASTEKWFRLC